MGQIKNIKLHIVTDIKIFHNGSKETWGDKLNNAILFDKPTYEKLYKEVPSYKLITPSVVSERLKVRASLAGTALEELAEKGLIKEIDRHHAQRIYPRAIKPAEE